MVIVFLAAAAEITGDFVAVENHVNGLLNIIKLRGGLASLHTHNNMQIKVCRYTPNSLHSRQPYLPHRLCTKVLHL